MLQAQRHPEVRGRSSSLEGWMTCLRPSFEAREAGERLRMTFSTWQDRKNAARNWAAFEGM